MKRRLFFCQISIILLFFSTPLFGKSINISILALDSDSYVITQAIDELKLPRIHIRYFSQHDLKKPEVISFVNSSKIIVVDIMMGQLGHFIIDNINGLKKSIYAVRESREDSLFKRHGFIFDHKVKDYFGFLCKENVKNLIRYLVNKEIDRSISYNDPIILPRLGIYHPDIQKFFKDTKSYKEWYLNHGKKANRPWIGIMIYSAYLTPGKREAIDFLIYTLEKNGFNVITAFGQDLDIIKHIFTRKDGKPFVSIILSFTLKFSSSLNKDLKIALEKIGIPIFDLINLFSSTIPQWKKDPKGIPLMDVTWCIATPEISGLIEPTVIMGKMVRKGSNTFNEKIVKEELSFLLPRIKAWIRLQHKRNCEKRVAILYYNHARGKQNIGASYLNIFSSLKWILKEMKKEGYHIKGDKYLNEKELKDLIIKQGRNIGGWAKGELSRMVRGSKAILLPIKEYEKWFKELPYDFQEKVIKQWGRPEDSFIMAKDKKFIIPGIRFGNIIIMPEPARGLSDDPMKLYHSTTLYPHHQYIAAYLWLKKVFKADAMIHLGTHATHEWLPGKQAGLYISCSPEVLITDIPNIYPYIVDDVGEGIQAKRRGRGVIIDHLIPPIKRSGLYGELAKLYELIMEYERAKARGSKTLDIKVNEIHELANRLGILQDLSIKEFRTRDIRRIEHYLIKIKEELMPYGLHTYGKSPDGTILKEMADIICEMNADENKKDIERRLAISGPQELHNLMRALNGRFIPSGEGNDPIRNPTSIPTGKNFYGFDPQKLPSPAAWELGKKMADALIKESIKKKGVYPKKIAIVLWATETIRNEGVNESAILYLLGMEPFWDKCGRLKGIRPIPGSILKRPRIDVLINPSGLYRDMFPNILLMLDKAIKDAYLLTDIENFVKENTEKIKERLVAKGIPPKKANTLAKLRIFSEDITSYGTGVSEMVANSGYWKKDQEIVDVYENRVGFVYGENIWGKRAKELFRENLSLVDTAIQSISSNIYATMDNDDMFQYLGGLSMAVKKESGEVPDTLIAHQKESGSLRVESSSETIGRELRSRYLNPKWINGMKKEEYAGAREMSKFVEYMWGWQVTTPNAINKKAWEETFNVYIKDKYKLGLKKFFKANNPWAFQSITARMLEAVRKGYWKADKKTREVLASEYAKNVIQNGLACCDHTCNNPLLNQMVANILSIPGVFSPALSKEFKLAIKKSMGKDLDQLVKERKLLQKKLSKGLGKEKSLKSRNKKIRSSRKKANVRKGQGSSKIYVEGFKMKEVKREDKTTKVSSSGVQWAVSLFIFFLMGIFFYGVKRGARSI